ncbi:glycosyltransferase family 1 protein [Parapedobacter luteus]|nr:glycosyltransferase family 1 protein [Parapedobacter luteus]
MKILFFTSAVEDYLGDGILIGLRALFGDDCIDYPKCEILYQNCPDNVLSQVRGKGFTLYTGLLDDIPIDRFNIEYKLQNGYYDLIIFGDIQRQFGLFVHFRPWLTKRNTIIMDGLDTSQPYPARGRWWRRPYYWFLPKAHKPFLYFKREWTDDTYFNAAARLLPAPVRRRLPSAKNLRSISFSVPEEKIVGQLPEKKKDFPKHIVDNELADKISGSTTTYAFQSEIEYYQDLQDARFGITTMRAGWDCLRHYEVAANGAVICFKDLDRKPHTCAPHGLKAGVNCIVYHDYDDLMGQINRLDKEKYASLQRKCWEWAHQNSSENKAKELLSVFTAENPQLAREISRYSIENQTRNSVASITDFL